MSSPQESGAEKVKWRRVPSAPRAGNYLHSTAAGRPGIRPAARANNHGEEKAVPSVELAHSLPLNPVQEQSPHSCLDTEHIWMASAQVQPSLVETETMWTQLLPGRAPCRMQGEATGHRKTAHSLARHHRGLCAGPEKQGAAWTPQAGALTSRRSLAVGAAVNWRPQTGSSGPWWGRFRVGTTKPVPGHLVPPVHTVLGLAESHL